MLVKICGLRREEDAKAAVKYGADALGFVMGGLVIPAEIEPAAQHVRGIIRSIRGLADTFVVTHLKNTDDIIALADYVGSTGIQVSEDIGPAMLREIRKKTSRNLIKTIVVDKGALKKLRAYEPYCDYILLDTRHKGYTGGTGKTNDWALCSRLVKAAKKPVYLAGGLTPENLADAIGMVLPHGVDVSTGVSVFSETCKRKDRKDHMKIRRFIGVARRWD